MMKWFPTTIDQGGSWGVPHNPLLLGGGHRHRHAVFPGEKGPFSMTPSSRPSSSSQESK
jgi:hypothetical protein